MSEPSHLVYVRVYPDITHVLSYFIYSSLSIPDSPFSFLLWFMATFSFDTHRAEKKKGYADFKLLTFWIKSSKGVDRIFDEFWQD